MKTSIKILSLLFIAFITFTACSKDDDPSDNDLFIGKYEGSVSYTHAEEDVDIDEEGSVTVVKVGNNYSFNFSDGIPSINNIKMEKGDNNTLIIEDDQLGIIRITASVLFIQYATDGRVWSANCSR